MSWTERARPGRVSERRESTDAARSGPLPSLRSLTESDLGRMTGGALLVYIAPLKEMKGDRPKVDPTNPDDEVIAVDVEAWWEIDRHTASWQEAPELGPQVLVGVYGRPHHRFVVGSLRSISRAGVMCRTPTSEGPSGGYLSQMGRIPMLRISVAVASAAFDSGGRGGSTIAGSTQTASSATRLCGADADKRRAVDGVSQGSRTHGRWSIRTGWTRWNL